MEETSGSSFLSWKDIELSESYLVCSMYEEAESLASSILKHICTKNEDFKATRDIELYDMLESAGMVFVQSLKELGRSSEILNELKKLFTSVAAIPVLVLLTGACFQISEGHSSSVREYLEEFLSKWSFVDERFYVHVGMEANLDAIEEYGEQYVLGVERYLEVVEVYVVTVSDDMDFAVSWVEKASLPEEKRREILRRLHSLYSLKPINSSQGTSNSHKAHYNVKEISSSMGFSSLMTAKYPIDGEDHTKQAISKFSRRMSPCFWWLCTSTLKLGNILLVISNGKILLGCSILLAYYVLRRKQSTFKRAVTKQALFMKKALTDMWQLAFSYQVNPLAAVQPLPARPNTR